MAKPMRKLSTGLSSWGTLMSGSVLGTGVSEDIVDGEEVVTLVELIASAFEGGSGDVRDAKFLYLHMAENAALLFKITLFG